MEPAKIELSLDRRVLTIAGERPAKQDGRDAGATAHLHERFTGRFRRVVGLPDDIDPDGVGAASDGVLHISVKRREATAPRRIPVQ